MVDHYALGYSAGYELPFVPTPVPGGVPPSTPDIRVLIDFVNDIYPQTPNDFSSVSNAPIWTDVSDRVRGGTGITSIRRGRERPLDRNEAGTASIVLDNWDRAFDPEADNSFAISPLMRRIRFEAGFARTTTAFKMGHSKVGGTDLVGGGASTIWEPIYDGVIESIEFDYPALGNDAIATIKCMDLLGVMAKDELSGSIGIDFFAPPAALHLALNYRPYTGRRGPDPVEGYPYNTTQEGDRDVGGRFDITTSGGDPAYVVHLGTYQGQPLRAAVDDIAAADGGNFYISRGGICTYRDHDWPLRPAGRIRVAVDAEKFADMDRVVDETLIYNYILLTGSGHEPPPFGVDPGPPYAILEDKGSQARYLRREWPNSEPGLFYQNHLDDRAEKILLRYREPQVYLAKLDMSNLVTDWKTMLTADLWDIITVEVTLPNGDVIEQRSMIEGIEISTPSRNLWNLAWWLSLPVFPNLFAPNDYSFEGTDALGTSTGSIGGWTAETNCSLLAQDVQLEQIGHRAGHFDPTITYTYDFQYVYASRGFWVLQMEATASGTISALAPAVEIDDRQVYVGKAQVRVVRFGLVDGVPSELNPATPPPLQTLTRTVTLEIDWYDENMVFLSKAVGTATSVPGLPITGWTTAKVDARAPNDAAFGQLRVKSAGSGQAGLYVDEVTLKRGA